MSETDHRNLETDRRYAETHHRHSETDRRNAETDRRHVEIDCRNLEADRRYAETDRRNLEADRQYAETDRCTFEPNRRPFGGERRADVSYVWRKLWALAACQLLVPAKSKRSTSAWCEIMSPKLLV